MWPLDQTICLRQSLGPLDEKWRIMLLFSAHPQRQRLPFPPSSHRRYLLCSPRPSQRPTTRASIPSWTFHLPIPLTHNYSVLCYILPNHHVSATFSNFGRQSGRQALDLCPCSWLQSMFSNGGAGERIRKAPSLRMLWVSFKVLR